MFHIQFDLISVELMGDLVNSQQMQMTYGRVGVFVTFLVKVVDTGEVIKQKLLFEVKQSSLMFINLAENAEGEEAADALGKEKEPE